LLERTVYVESLDRLDINDVIAVQNARLGLFQSQGDADRL